MVTVNLQRSFCMIWRASMAAVANIGGRDAEKQYPNPDNLWNTEIRGDVKNV
jgi:hypothetical protein